jgi:hypothetical protein
MVEDLLDDVVLQIVLISIEEWELWANFLWTSSNA